MKLGWNEWPKDNPANNHHMDLNQAIVAMDQDLNELPAVEDPLEMIINHALNNGLEEEQQIDMPFPPPEPANIILAVGDIPMPAHFPVMQV